MTQEELIAECTVYDYKEALEEKKPKGIRGRFFDPLCRNHKTVP